MQEEAYQLLKLKRGTPYVIVRFVTWQAFHDKGHTGLSLENKLRVVYEMENMLISSLVLKEIVYHLN